MMKRVIIIGVLFGLMFVGCKGASNSASNVDTDGVLGAGGIGGQLAGTGGAGGLELEGSAGISMEGSCSAEDETPCGEGFACVEGRCKRMRPCDAAGCLPNQVCEWVEQLGELRCIDEECEPGYFWDVENDRCAVVEGTTCEAEEEDSITEACLGFQRTCAEDDERAWCGTCNDGFLWQSSFCIQKQTCADLRCAGQNRACLEGDAFSDDACGSCNEGFGEVEGLCERVVVDPMGPAGGMGGSDMMGLGDPCLVCDTENRICNDAVNGVAECGMCVDDLTDVEGVCREVGDCEDLDCASDNRLCESDPVPYCLEQCVEGFYWNTDAGECQQAQSCAALECGDGFVCVESDGESDAHCERLEHCPAGFGKWIQDDPDNWSCLSCDVVPDCDVREGTGLTEHLYVMDTTDGVRCQCETREGFFWNESRTAAYKCDADGDGWLNDDAFPYVNHNNLGIRDNARCSVRQVVRIKLINDYCTEDGCQEHLVPLVGAQGVEETPLPLFEKPDNDRNNFRLRYDADNNEGVPQRMLNSFTKACTSESADFNLNGIEDVVEGRAPVSAQEEEGEGQGDNGQARNIDSLYDRYLNWSYFMELHDGWFVADAGRDLEPMDGAGGAEDVDEEVAQQVGRVVYGTYVIKERSRGGLVPTMPLESHEESAQPGEEENDYWRSCGRHADPLYSADAESFVGGDFTQAAAREVNGGIENNSAWWGMGHHSQFKCIHVQRGPVYQNANGDAPRMNRDTNPEKVIMDGQGVNFRFVREFLDDQGEYVPERNQWYANRCSIAEGESRSESAEANPTFATFDCNKLPFQNADGQQVRVEVDNVYWAVVGYENDIGQEDARDSYDYKRGCINECVELEEDACPNYDPADGPTHRMTCNQAGQDNYGKIECGCHLSFGGPSCSYYCGANDSFSLGYNVYTRAGSWMCGEFRPTGETEFTGNGMMLRGHVSMGIPEKDPAFTFGAGGAEADEEEITIKTVDYRIKDFREPEEN